MVSLLDSKNAKEKRRKSCRFQNCCKMSVDLQNRLRYSRAAALQSHIFLFSHPREFEVQKICQRPDIAAWIEIEGSSACYNDRQERK